MSTPPWDEKTPADPMLPFTMNAPLPLAPLPRARKSVSAGALVICICLASLIASIVGGAVALSVNEVQQRRNDAKNVPAVVKNSPRGAATETEAARRVYEDSSPAVVHVTANVSSEPDFLGNTREGVATGSGFVIDDRGHVVTNAHVIDGATAVTVTFPGKKEYPVKILGSDASTDVAVLQVQASAADLAKLQSVRFADSSKARVGDYVIAIGNPLALDYTATSGIISATGREITAPNGFVIDEVLQTDAAINQGNSGGPLLDTEGNVVGVNSQIATSGTSTGSIGIGFAIPSNTVHDIATQLIRSGKIERPYFGVSGIELTPSLAAAFNMPVDEGILIANVQNGSPADEAGLRAGDTAVQVSDQLLLLGGDIVTKIAGDKVTTRAELLKAVASHAVGDSVSITYWRGDKKRTTKAKLVSRPDGK